MQEELMNLDEVLAVAIQPDGSAQVVVEFDGGMAPNRAVQWARENNYDSFVTGQFGGCEMTLVAEVIQE